MAGRFAARSPKRPIELTVLDAASVDATLLQVQVYDRADGRLSLINLSMPLAAYQRLEDEGIFGVGAENLAPDAGVTALTNAAPVELELEVLNPPTDADTDAAADELAKAVGTQPGFSSINRYRWWRTLQETPSPSGAVIMRGFRSRFAAKRG